jgi:hypothetical protein
MEQAAIARGLHLRPSELSKLQERVGGNPALAERAIDEELIGTSIEGGDHGLYFDITPLIAMIGVIFICLRFIGLGTNNQALYIFSGIGAACFMGFTLAVRSLPKESRRIG